jgi:hypothetical protein
VQEAFSRAQPAFAMPTADVDRHAAFSRGSRHQRTYRNNLADQNASLDPLMQKPGGDHREVGERPSRRAILNPSGNP